MSVLSDFKKPDGFCDIIPKLERFLASVKQEGKVVLVTSGGTCVPLEKNMIRFLDNFSTGSRGAASTEQFLKQGYRVIFLYRQGSLCPFQRFVPDSKILLNSFNIRYSTKESNSKNICLKLQSSQLQNVLTDFNKYKSDLLSISFTTLDDYMHLLKSISCMLKPFAQRAAVYLAAAVSDFYIPFKCLPEHKIQSSGNELCLTLKPVPKVIKELISDWVDNAFVVTFKLETDEKLLLQKSHAALKSNRNQAVVANILSSRKRRILVVTAQKEHVIDLSQRDLNDEVEIEQPLVDQLTHLHENFIKKCQSNV